MVDKILWLALGLLIIASIVPGKNKIKFAIAGTGWFFFSINWLLQLPHYYELGDYVNAILVVVATVISAFIGYALVREDYIKNRKINDIDITASLFMITTAAAVGGLSYFFFSEIPEMNHWLISKVTDQTIWLASVFGVAVTKLDWNLIAVNGYRVEIILACTAIESIALFMGIIACVKAPFKRLALAFLISVPVIYLLNLMRNVFVVNAYGMLWFGDPETSFYMAHTVIAKFGSLIALFFITYAVLKILPEIIDMIDGVYSLIGGIFKNAG